MILWTSPRAEIAGVDSSLTVDRWYVTFWWLKMIKFILRPSALVNPMEGVHKAFFIIIFFLFNFCFKKKKKIINRTNCGPPPVVGPALQWRSGFIGVNSQDTSSLIFIILIYFFFRKPCELRLEFTNADALRFRLRRLTCEKQNKRE